MSNQLIASNWRSVYSDLQEQQRKPHKDYPAILTLASHLITRHSRGLGQNVWAVYESIVVASLDCNQFDIAKSALGKLSARFPRSTRVLVLQGMLLEAQGMEEEALSLYQEVIENEPMNRESRRRKVAVYKSKGQPKLAMQELCSYLARFLGDIEAWLELAELYTVEFDLNQAGYCVEEVILTNPLNYLYHLKYAEICYSRGEDYWDSAAKHYTKVLTLNRDCVRALYGVILTFYAIMKFSKQNLQTKESSLVEWARGRLVEVYTSAGNEMGTKMLRNTLGYFEK